MTKGKKPFNNNPHRKKEIPRLPEELKQYILRIKSKQAMKEQIAKIEGLLPKSTYTEYDPDRQVAGLEIGDFGRRIRREMRPNLVVQTDVGFSRRGGNEDASAEFSDLDEYRGLLSWDSTQTHTSHPSEPFLFSKQSRY